MHRFCLSEEASLASFGPPNEDRLAFTACRDASDWRCGCVCGSSAPSHCGFLTRNPLKLKTRQRDATLTFPIYNQSLHSCILSRYPIPPPQTHTHAHTHTCTTLSLRGNNFFPVFSQHRKVSACCCCCFLCPALHVRLLSLTFLDNVGIKLIWVNLHTICCSIKHLHLSGIWRRIR